MTSCPFSESQSVPASHKLVICPLFQIGVIGIGQLGHGRDTSKMGRTYMQAQEIFESEDVDNAQDLKTFE